MLYSCRLPRLTSHRVSWNISSALFKMPDLMIASQQAKADVIESNLKLLLRAPALLQMSVYFGKLYSCRVAIQESTQARGWLCFSTDCQAARILSSKPYGKVKPIILRIKTSSSQTYAAKAKKLQSEFTSLLKLACCCFLSSLFWMYCSSLII